ncbi:MAG: hypothetical protein KDJ63_13475, partial [Nitratireductor sp.]|nr:hypothetical protein [Nitratireductor sp.]
VGRVPAAKLSTFIKTTAPGKPAAKKNGPAQGRSKVMGIGLPNTRSGVAQPLAQRPMCSRPGFEGWGAETEITSRGLRQRTEIHIASGPKWGGKWVISRPPMKFS